MAGSYKFLDHTADIAVEVSGETLEELFITSAEAWRMCAVEIDKVDVSETRELNLSAYSIEELLVGFLSELNYLLIVKKWVSVKIDSIQIKVDAKGANLISKISGTTLNPNNKLKQEIKAVTYHQLEIKKIINNYSTLIVFDI